MHLAGLLRGGALLTDMSHVDGSQAPLIGRWLEGAKYECSTVCIVVVCPSGAEFHGRKINRVMTYIGEAGFENSQVGKKF